MGNCRNHGIEVQYSFINYNSSEMVQSILHQMIVEKIISNPRKKVQSTTN